jgi:hypothetical protein
MAIFNFTVTLKKGKEIETEKVSVESLDGTVSNEQFFSLLPDKYKDWEITDIKKK